MVRALYVTVVLLLAGMASMPNSSAGCVQDTSTVDLVVVRIVDRTTTCDTSFPGYESHSTQDALFVEQNSTGIVLLALNETNSSSSSSSYGSSYWCSNEAQAVGIGITNTGVSVTNYDCGSSYSGPSYASGGNNTGHGLRLGEGTTGLNAGIVAYDNTYWSSSGSSQQESGQGFRGVDLYDGRGNLVPWTRVGVQHEQWQGSSTSGCWESYSIVIQHGWTYQALGPAPMRCQGVWQTLP